MDWTDDLALAQRMADAADAITLARFRAADLRVETKPDLTPVSDADRDVERAIREILAAERPGDAILGEEYGESGAAGVTGRRWVVDPIDGTKSFVRGVPVWASLIALEVDGRTVVGVVSAPALGTRWWGSRGGGAWADGLPPEGSREPRRLRVSAVSALADASVSASSLPGWRTAGRLEGFLDLVMRVWRSRAYGDFWSHMLVAEGAVDASFEPELSRWDMAALQVVVEEAGGRFTSLEGESDSGGGSLVCSNGLLHDEVLAALAPRSPG